MSLSSDVSRVQYTLTTSGQTLPVTFKFLESDELAVVQTVDGVDTPLVLNTDYTVTGGGSVPALGNVLMVAGQADDLITIYRNADYLQESVYISNDRFPAKTTETNFDRAVMLIQQLVLAVGRSFRFANTQAPVADLDIEDFKGNVLGFDDNGNPIPYAPGGGSGGGGVFGNVAITSGALTVAVTFATAFTSTPKVVCSVQMPNSSGDNIFATVIRDSLTTTGFTASLSGPPSASGYYLTYTAGT